MTTRQYRNQTSPAIEQMYDEHKLPAGRTRDDQEVDEVPRSRLPSCVNESARNPRPKRIAGFVVSTGVSVNLDALLYGYQAAAYLRCSRQRIQRWRDLGHLQPAAHDHKGRPQYRLRDVLEAERITRRSPNSHRALATT